MIILCSNAFKPTRHASYADVSATFHNERRKLHALPSYNDKDAHAICWKDEKHVDASLTTTKVLAPPHYCSDIALQRRALLFGAFSTHFLPSSAKAEEISPAVPAPDDIAIQLLTTSAFKAYNEKDLPLAKEYFTKIINRDATNPGWLERRGQVEVDMKDFEEAIEDFNSAESMYRDTDPTYVSLGLLTNRGLAYEGLYWWREALANYNEAVYQSTELGYSIPYILNSRGNCHASLASLAPQGSIEAEYEWQQARNDYKAAAQVFQKSRNLSGAIFASSNAALMAAQLGQDSIALQELSNTARRAPGSIDMRAATAAIYWAAGDEQKAESQWNWACSKINSGQLVPGGPILDSCDRYADSDWLSRIRRWPPVMVQRMGDFLALREARVPAAIR